MPDDRRYVVREWFGGPRGEQIRFRIVGGSDKGPIIEREERDALGESSWRPLDGTINAADRVHLYGHALFGLAGALIQTDLEYGSSPDGTIR